MLERATPADVPAAVDCLVAAFSADPLMAHLFPGPTETRLEMSGRFFSLLLRARIALDMPALVLRDGQGLGGAAMGYTTARPAWPADINAEWASFMAYEPAFQARFDAYDAASSAGEPKTPHYYLGVIGVSPRLKGTGLGSQLLKAYCDASASDPASSGVYLDTTNPANLPFYEHHGFEVQAERTLGAARVWCLFHPHVRT